MSKVISLSLKIDDLARQNLKELFDQAIANVRDASDMEDRIGFYHFALGMIETCSILHAHLLPHGVIQALEDANEAALIRLEL